MSQNINLLYELYTKALKAVDPYDCAKKHINIIRDHYITGGFREIICAAFGKASCTMSSVFLKELGEFVKDAIAITKHKHCKKNMPSGIKIIEAGHPVPDENGLRGSNELINIISNADEQTLVVCLISGGGSALLVSPYDGITLGEKQQITEMLLKSGANIFELNTVRKHLSKVKGGRLMEIAYPAHVISLILSDVIGDRLDVIASGPTTPDETTYQDAIGVFEKYSLLNRIPGKVLDILYKGYWGLIPETPNKDNGIFSKVENIIIGSNRKALDAAKKAAEEHDLYAVILSSEMSGEAREAGKWLAQTAKEIFNTLGIQNKRKICLISGGETTVTVKGSGKGGRNMELALSFAIEIEGIEGITLLSAGTDGTDGPTDAAGAIVNGRTISGARKMGLDPSECLLNNDSYNFFKSINGLFITGPTGTNVMDIQIVLIE